MIWNYNLRLLLGVFLFLLFCSVYFIFLLMNSTKVPLYQDEVSKDVFESERWEDLEKMLREKLKRDRDQRERESKSDFLLPITDSAIPSLAAVAAFPPPVPPSNSCSIPPLPSNPTCNDPAFTGTVLPKPRRIVLMLLFGFEVFTPFLSPQLTFQVDTLEVMLREVVDLVAKIFLVENTVTHRGAFKPLLWERLK